jgi:hypothetical protein
MRVCLHYFVSKIQVLRLLIYFSFVYFNTFNLSSYITFLFLLLTGVGDDENIDPRRWLKRLPVREARRVSSVDIGSSASPSSSSGSEDEMSSMLLNNSGTPEAPSADKAERIEIGRRIRKALDSISMGASAETFMKSCAREPLCTSRVSFKVLVLLLVGNRAVASSPMMTTRRRLRPFGGLYICSASCGARTEQAYRE